MSLKNKIVGSFLIIIAIMLLSSFFVSYNVNNIENQVTKLEKKDFKGITVLLEADRDSYQSNIAIVQIFSLEDKEKIAKLKNEITKNLKQVRDRFNLFKSVLKNRMNNLSVKFNEFEKYLNLTNKNTNIIISLVNSNNIDKAKEFYFNTYLKDYESMRSLIDYFSNQTYNVIDKNIYTIDTLIENSFYAFIIISIFSLIIVFIFTYLLRRNINNSFSSFTIGVQGFFDYLNRKTTSVNMLNDSTKDEIGHLSKIVNENITISKKGIDEDRDVIKEIIQILEKLAHGDLSKRINISVSNPALKQLKDILNEMASKMQNNIENILDVLDQYSNYNYVNKVETTNLQNHFFNLSMGINNLNDSITEMLQHNSSTGITLNSSSLTLLDNVEKLSKSSNASAVFLEETAAALDEVTSTVANNTQHIQNISKYTSNLKESSNDGEKLAKDTALSMDEINEQTQSIAEAITVIDQIAFQTNILSLNAAVEAATAGEAGKGFAVVAQEVRNLASRSAEAAKEIKELVENATIKANQGKQISDKMIEGYHGVNENVNKTLELIQGISTASKEQQSGIEQINNAICDLDHQTQNNASVASLTNEIASKTLEIAEEIVKNANDKDFRGKEKRVVNL